MYIICVRRTQGYLIGVLDIFNKNLLTSLTKIIHYIFDNFFLI